MTEHLDEENIVDSLKNITAELTSLNMYENSIKKQNNDLDEQIKRFQKMMKSWDDSISKQIGNLNEISKTLDKRIQECSDMVDTLIKKNSEVVFEIGKMKELIDNGNTNEALDKRTEGSEGKD